MKKDKKPTIIIGLTGGAGSGKSTVAQVFQRHGACIIDADKLGHQLLEKKSPCFDKVIKAFGPSILSGKNSIDRARLGELVFSDPAKLRRLNRIVHPALLKEIDRNILFCWKKYPARPMVIDAALIVQWGLAEKLEILIMVDSIKKLRLARMQTRGMSRRMALKIMASQMPVRLIREKAGRIITNNGAIKDLEKKAATMWKEINGKLRETEKKVELSRLFIIQ
jgi:dephospho-CoA kinase